MPPPTVLLAAGDLPLKEGEVTFPPLLAHRPRTLWRKTRADAQIIFCYAKHTCATVYSLSNGDLSPNPILQGYLRHFPHAFELRVANIGNLAAGTALEGSKLLNLNDGKVWIDGDLVRCESMAVCGWTWTRCSQGIWNPYWCTSSSRSGTATVSTLHRSMLDVFQVQQINLISLSMVHSCISTNVRRTSVKSSISW